MTITTVSPEMCGKPDVSLYPPPMAKRILMGIQELRSSIGKLASAIEGDEHIVLSYRGKVFAVVTPIKWYRKAATKMDDPTEY
jgi:hypothetical protein